MINYRRLLRKRRLPWPLGPVHLQHGSRRLEPRPAVKRNGDVGALAELSFPRLAEHNFSIRVYSCRALLSSTHSTALAWIQRKGKDRRTPPPPVLGSARTSRTRKRVHTHGGTAPLPPPFHHHIQDSHYSLTYPSHTRTEVQNRLNTSKSLSLSLFLKVTQGKRGGA